MERTITVTGRGAIHVVPDVTRLEVYISGRFKTYQDAYDQAKENFAQMVKILEYNNKPGTLAKTVHMDISDFEKSIKDSLGHHMYYVWKRIFKDTPVSGAWGDFYVSEKEKRSRR